MIPTLIVVASLLALTLLLSYICYDYIYKSPKKGQNDAHRIFDDKNYEKPLREATEALLALPYSDVATLSFDGLVLHGRLYDEDESAHLVICFHGYRSVFGKDFATVFHMMKKHGYSCLLIDERAHMQSAGKCLTFGINERKDALAWAKEMAERFPNRSIFLYGMSMGAATVVMSSELDLPKNVKGIVADAPYHKPWTIVRLTMQNMNKILVVLYPFALLGALIFGHFSLTKASGENAVKNTKCPICIFHGLSDPVVPASYSKELQNANPDIIRYEIENADHCLSCLVAPDFYEEKLIGFLDSHK